MTTGGVMYYLLGFVIVEGDAVWKLAHSLPGSEREGLCRMPDEKTSRKARRGREGS